MRLTMVRPPPEPPPASYNHSSPAGRHTHGVHTIDDRKITSEESLKKKINDNLLIKTLKSPKTGWKRRHARYKHQSRYKDYIKRIYQGQPPRTTRQKAYNME
eukprot:13927386-Ditylum_brightwellii.AAC.1